jgi:hypothetical protein
VLRSNKLALTEKNATLKSAIRGFVMSMKHIARALMIVVTMATFGATSVLAEDCGPGMMGCGRQGMKGRGMMDKGMQERRKLMDKKMQELHQHQKLMEGVKDTDQMMAEMRKQMEMITDMMEEIMRQQGGSMGGSQAMPEH